MARGIAGISTYDQRSTPSGRAQPSLRPVALPQSIGASMARVGEAFGDVAQAAEYRDEMALRAEEDDARVYVSTAMAKMRADASGLRQRVFEEAPDGFRGADTRFSEEFSKLRREALSSDRGLTGPAQRFLTEAIDTFEPGVLADISDDMSRARGAWQADTMRSAIDQGGSVLAADPRQYEPMRAQQLEVLAGLSDANTRRDLTAYMEEGYARSVVAGLIDRDPSGALRSLRDPESGGAFARLDGTTRAAAIKQAQNEIEQRTTRYRANVRDRVESARYAASVGVGADWPDADEVTRALGPVFGTAYAVERETYSAQSDMQRMSDRDLSSIALERPAEGASQQERLVSVARAAAAQNIREQRAFDPMGVAVRNGLANDDGAVAQAIQDGNFATLVPLLRSRASIAAEQSASLGTRPDPLTRSEAQALRARLDGIADPFVRQQALSALFDAPTRARGRDGAFGQRDSRLALARQLYPELPGAQQGALLMGRNRAVGGERGVDPVPADAASRRLLFGASLLARPDVATLDDRGGAREPMASSGRSVANGPSAREVRGETFQMPSDAALQRVFDDYVQDAYDNPNEYRQDYQSFLAYVAGAGAERRLVLGNSGGETLSEAWKEVAEEGARVATGGVTNWHGRNIILPWGMSRAGFEQSVRGLWETPGFLERHPGLPSDPEAIDLEHVGGGRYEVKRGDDALGVTIRVGGQ